MINPAELYKLNRAQSRMKKQMEAIFATTEKRGIKVTVRGDQRIERIEIDGEENKELKDVINNAMKDVTKKTQKQLRGELGNLGIPGL